VGDEARSVTGEGSFAQAAATLAADGGGASDEEELATRARALGQRAVQHGSEHGVAVTPPGPPAVTEFHVCAGLNACKGHDVDGQAMMAGTGACATSQHVCHGEGACRGQGGCGYAGSAYEQAIPAEQSCSHHGSCASPINECRVSSMGPNKGKSVWKLARKLFEARAFNAQVQYQPATREGLPDFVVPTYVTSVPGAGTIDFGVAEGVMCRMPHPEGPQDNHGADGGDPNLCRIPK